jgi:CHAT domain-containing protein
MALTWEEGSSGLVRYQDVLGLHLDTNLAVLSACNTGAGNVFPRQGPLSLARAFLHAGSRAVIASLWEADDLATRDLMERFYSEYIGHGRSPFVALREAKLELLHRSGNAVEARGDRGAAPGSSQAVGGARVRATFGWAGFVYFGLPR